MPAFGPCITISRFAYERIRDRPHPPGPPCEGRRLVAILDAGQPVALYLAVRPCRFEGARLVRDRADFRRQARDHRGAVYFQMGDRRAGGPRHRADRTQRLAGLGAGDAGDDDARLWRHAHPDGRAHAMARRHFRQGGDECGAPACVSHLRAHASALAALPSRAQDRRADARARARPQRHRDHRAHVAAAADADHRRGGAGRLGAAVPLRLALSDRGPADDRALCRLHLLCHRMAHQHPPLDERERHRRQCQGDRTRC